MDSNAMMIDDDDGGSRPPSSMMMSTPPPPPSFHGEAPLAQPDDDLRTPGGIDDTTTGTGSTVSPVSPVHKTNAKAAATMDDDGGAAIAAGYGRDTVIIPLVDRDDDTPPPPRHQLQHQQHQQPQQPQPPADDRDVPVVSMSGGPTAAGLPAIATPPESAKGNGGQAEPAAAADGKKEKDNKKKDKAKKDEPKKDKAKYSTAGTDGTTGDDGNSAAAQRYTSGATGCPATTEYVLLTVLCAVLLIACTAGTVYWTVAFRGGYDTTPAAAAGGSSWFPWPPPSLKEILHVGVFTYQLQNGSQQPADQSFFTTTTTAQPAVSQNASQKVSLAERRFNLHPTMMTAGFVTITGFSILVYRLASKCTGPGCKTSYLKLTHSLLHTLVGIPCVIIGALAAAQYHTSTRLPHLYTVHSWMGTFTYSLFLVQLILGLFTFVVLLCCRAATARCRLRCFAPVHATLGLCTFTLAIGTCLTGLQQRADTVVYTSNNGNLNLAGVVNEKLRTAAAEPLVINCLATLFVLTLVVVSYTVRRDTLKRYRIGAGGPPLISSATVSPMRGPTGASIKSSGSTRKLQPPV